ncbi:hypothetical protein IP88_10910, partial [alpha proteobacterium AAP81b]
MVAASRLLPLLGLLAGCGDAPDASRLRVVVTGAETSLAAALEAEATQPTLVTRDSTGGIVAALATSWRFVDDGRGLILRLRPVRWADGKPLVARDVVAALRRAARRRDPALLASGIALGGRGATMGARAPIDRVVELRLA